LSELKRVFDEYIALLKKLGAKGRLNITGGEPLLREDLLDFLEYISRYKQYFRRCTLLTNGSLLTKKFLQAMKKRAPIVSGIQISVEGPEEINDKIRGKGTFQKILQAVSLVKEHEISVHLAATVSHMNYPQILELLDLLLIYDIRMTLRRFVPIGGGKQEIAAMLKPEELRDFYIKVEKLNQKYRLKNGNAVFKTDTCMSGLKYAEWPNSKFHNCDTAKKNKSSLAIMPNGDVYPCRLFPQSIGNLRKQTLKEIYEKNYEKILRNGEIDMKCKKCEIFTKCQGGAGCISAAVTRNFFAKDPQCWK
jgi:radical SAM protein with 4Fe4S-binding SPASM domain